MLDYTDTHCIERELLLAKVSILGPEYLEEQLVGGPTHEPRRISHSHTAHRPAEHAHEQSKQEREAALVHQFEHSADPSAYPDAEADPAVPLAEPLTPSQALRLKSDNLQAIQTLSAQFGGRIVDVSEHSVIVEMCGKTKRVEAFLSLLKPFGVLESARTGGSPVSPATREVALTGSYIGLMVMPRTPIKNMDESDAAGEGGVVDASLLPPG